METKFTSKGKSVEIEPAGYWKFFAVIINGKEENCFNVTEMYDCNSDSSTFEIEPPPDEGEEKELINQAIERIKEY